MKHTSYLNRDESGEGFIEWHGVGPYMEERLYSFPMDSLDRDIVAQIRPPHWMWRAIAANPPGYIGKWLPFGRDQIFLAGEVATADSWWDDHVEYSSWTPFIDAWGRVPDLYNRIYDYYFYIDVDEMGQPRLCIMLFVHHPRKDASRYIRILNLTEAEWPTIRLWIDNLCRHNRAHLTPGLIKGVTP